MENCFKVLWARTKDNEEMQKCITFKGEEDLIFFKNTSPLYKFLENQ